MAVPGIGAISDRIGKIASQIAEIENRNPMNRTANATSGPTGTRGATAPVSANAFQQHLASQTMQTLNGAANGAGTANGVGAGGTGAGLAGLAQAGLAGSSGTTGALTQRLGGHAALGNAALAGSGLAASLVGSAGSASPMSGAAQALTALLQAGSKGPNPTLAVQSLQAAVAPAQQPPRMRANTTDPVTSGIAALPKDTHPAIPERRNTKVPQELKRFGNGKIPADQLESVGVKDHQLWSPAAKAFKLMRAAAQRDGINIGVNSSYRDVACQQCMVDKYGIYGQGGRAAPPGKSNHGWGLSIDLQLDESAKKWMRANAKHYGFVEDVAREPWHWTFIADGDSVQANAQALLR